MGQPPDEGHDLNHPPPGCKAAVCPTCGGDGLVQVPRKAVGPIPGTDLDGDEVGTILGWSMCRVCKGRGWIWVDIAAPGVQQYKPDNTMDGDESK
jgi:hypothetical protein